METLTYSYELDSNHHLYFCNVTKKGFHILTVDKTPCSHYTVCQMPEGIRVTIMSGWEDEFS